MYKKIFILCCLSFFWGCSQAPYRVSQSKSLVDSDSSVKQQKNENNYLRKFLIAGNFKQGSIELTDYGKTLLDEVGQYLSQVSYSKVIIESYTDSIGDFTYNKMLSQRRAQQMKNYLVRRWNAPRNLVEALGMGSENPIDTNETPEGRLNNRRTLLYIY